MRMKKKPIKKDLSQPGLIYQTRDLVNKTIITS